MRRAAARGMELRGGAAGARTGEGLGNKFLGNIRECDAIVHVVRCFGGTDIVHVDGSVDPLRDIETIDTELILSELVTNAIRYGTEPIQVRLIHDRTLICEVSDGSSTAPHLRHAATTDEGGRGLFLVAQLAQAWGTRYTSRGKIIWAECALEASDGVPDLLDGRFFENQFADIPDIG